MHFTFPVYATLHTNLLHNAGITTSILLSLMLGVGEPRSTSPTQHQREDGTNRLRDTKLPGLGLAVAIIRD